MVSKRVLKVKTLKGEYDSSYAHTGLMFAYCSKIINNEVKQTTNFCSCREDLASYLFYDKRNKMPIDRSRYIVRHIADGSNKKASEAAEKWFNKTTEAGLRIVNAMEDRHGWPLSNMTDVIPNINKIPTDYHNSGRELITFRKVLIGSGKWLKSPHMISLYILLFRLGGNRKFSSIKDYKGLSKACNACNAKQIGDAYHVFRTFKFWDMIMANFDKMFAGMPTRSNFKAEKYDGDYYDEGISKLCRFRCKNENISSKFVALAKKAGLE
jgi:hypothetical protein